MSYPFTPAGEFRYRVTILKRDTNNLDETGETVPQNVPEQTRWAKITTPSADERYRAAQVYENVTHVITMRYTPDLTYRDSLRYKGRVFDIASLIDIDELHIELVALCHEQK